MAELCKHKDIFGVCLEQPDSIFIYAINTGTINDIPEIDIEPQKPINPNDPNEPSASKADERDEYASRVRGTRVARVPKIKTQNLSEADIINAKLNRAAMLNKTENVEAAQKYLDDNGLDTYKIDKELSTRDAIVVSDEVIRDNELVDFMNAFEREEITQMREDNGIGNDVTDTELIDIMNSNENVVDEALIDYLSTKDIGEYKVIFAGTDTNSASDLVTDAQIVAGKKSTGIKQINDAREFIEEVALVKGKMPVEIGGFSLGGYKAIIVSEEFGIKSTTFNPLINSEIVNKGNIYSEHTIIRTTTDPVSMNLARGNNDFFVKNVEPIDETLNPTSSHDLRHFTDEVEVKQSEATKLMGRGLHPSTIGIGLVGSIAGEEFLAKIDPKHKINPVAGQGIAGGMAGFTTATMTSALAGEALVGSVLLPEMVAGAAGFASAQAVTSAVEKSMYKDGYSRNTSEASADVVGGTVGGAAATAVSLGTSVALATATGGEIGALLAPETFGLSILVGMGVGAAAGGVAYGVSKIPSSTVSNIEKSINNASNVLAHDISKTSKNVGKTVSNWFK